MPIHHNSLEEKKSQYDDFLRIYEPKIICIVENTQRLKKEYEGLQQQLTTPLLKNSNLGLLKKQHAFEQAVTALDNTVDLVNYFLELLKNPKITPALPSTSSQLDDVLKQITDKIKRLPHPEINQLLLRCLLSYNSGNNLKNLDTIRFWTGNDLGREGLLDCLVYQWNIDYEKTSKKLSKVKSTIEHVAHRQNEIRMAVKELLQQLQKLQYINQKRKGIPEEQIKQALVNMIPSLQNINNTRPLTEALEEHLNNLIDSSPNIDALDILSQQIKKTNELFRFTVTNQTKRHFTKHLKRFTTKERKVNDLLSPTNSVVSFATDIDKRDEVVDTLKQALKSNSQRSTKKSIKPAVLTLSSKLIGNIYTAFNRGFSELFYGFLPDSLSLDDIDFKLLENPYFSYDDFVKFFDENTEALNTASKQLDALSVSLINKVDDAANERLGNNDPYRDTPSDDVHSILGYRDPEVTHDAFAKILTRTAHIDVLDKQNPQVAQKHDKQPIANPAHSNTAEKITAPTHKLPLPARLADEPAATKSTTQPIPANPGADLTASNSNLQSLSTKSQSGFAAPQPLKQPIPTGPATPHFTIQSSPATLVADISAPKSKMRSLPPQPTTRSVAPSSKARSLPTIPVKTQTIHLSETNSHAAQTIDNKEKILTTVTTVEELPVSGKPHASSTSHSLPPLSSDKKLQSSRTTRSETLPTNTVPTNTLNIILTNKVLIPHVIAVRKYQSVLKSLSTDIQNQLALFVTAKTINPDTQYMLETLKHKLDARARAIDANPITDYQNHQRYSFARNIIINDQASFGNTLNIHKTIIASKETCTPTEPEPTLSWFGWMTNTLHSLSKSVQIAVKNIYNKVFTSTNDLSETKVTPATDINTATPYAFINSIQKQFEAASAEALERIDQYDNHMKSEQEHRLEYANSSGIFNSLANKANMSLATSTDNTLTKKVASSSAATPANNPHGFYANPEHEAKRHEKRHAKKALSKTLPSQSINNEPNHSFTVCF